MRVRDGLAGLTLERPVITDSRTERSRRVHLRTGRATASGGGRVDEIGWDRPASLCSTAIAAAGGDAHVTTALTDVVLSVERRGNTAVGVAHLGFTSEIGRRTALSAWLHPDNPDRQCTALDSLPPITRCTDVSGRYSQPSNLFPLTGRRRLLAHPGPPALAGLARWTPHAAPQHHPLETSPCDVFERHEQFHLRLSPVSMSTGSSRRRPAVTGLAVLGVTPASRVKRAPRRRPAEPRPARHGYRPTSTSSHRRSAGARRVAAAPRSRRRAAD
jgi:hypothetical protein